MVDYSGTIVVTGRGGTGKSTFTTLMARYLGEKGVEPILMVDADPDMSLAEMLGINLAKQNKRTISDVLSDIIENRRMTKMIGMSPTEKIEPFLFQECLYEGDTFFDFISVGTKWIEGCYCLPDRSLSQIMDKWSENYRYVIIDSPAGVEHLNRRISKNVKDVFNILDPSKKSLDNAARSYKIMQQVDIKFQNYYLVGGFRFTEYMEAEALKQPYKYIGRIINDEKINEYNIEGKSLLNLPKGGAFNSVSEILSRVGY